MVIRRGQRDCDDDDRDGMKEEARVGTEINVTATLKFKTNVCLFMHQDKSHLASESLHRV